MTGQGMSTERATGSQAGSLRDRLAFARELSADIALIAGAVTASALRAAGLVFDWRLPGWRADG